MQSRPGMSRPGESNSGDSESRGTGERSAATDWLQKLSLAIVCFDSWESDGTGPAAAVADDDDGQEAEDSGIIRPGWRPAQRTRK